MREFIICHPFRLPIWTLFIGQFVHPVGEGIVNLASCEYHYIRVHENLMQYPSALASIDIKVKE